MDYNTIVGMAYQIKQLAEFGEKDRSKYAGLISQMEPYIEHTEQPACNQRLFEELKAESDRRKELLATSDGSMAQEAGLYLQQVRTCLYRKFQNDGIGSVSSIKTDAGLLVFTVLLNSHLNQAVGESSEEYFRRKEAVAVKRTAMFGEDAGKEPPLDIDKNRATLAEYFSDFQPCSMETLSKNGRLQKVIIWLNKNSRIEPSVFTEREERGGEYGEQLTVAQVEETGKDATQILDAARTAYQFHDGRLNEAAGSLICTVYQSMCGSFGVRNRFYKEPKTHREDFAIARRHSVSEFLSFIRSILDGAENLALNRYGMHLDFSVSPYTANITMHLNICPCDLSESNKKALLDCFDIYDDDGWEWHILNTERSRKSLSELAAKEFAGSICKMNLMCQDGELYITSVDIQCGVYGTLAVLGAKFGT